VHDDIAQIDQNPVADTLAFDAERFELLLFDRFDDMTGKKFDMRLGGSAGDHHEVRHAGFALNIDGFDIVSFTVIQRSQDDFQ